MCGPTGITISKSSALSMSVLLIFKMQPINGVLFLNDYFKCLFFVLLLLPPPTVIVPLKTIYASLKSHKSDLSNDVLNLFVYSVCIYLQHYLTDHELLPIFWL